MLITTDSVWVANDQLKAVQRIDPKRNKVVATIQFTAEPCSGLAYGFGSVWVPLCGEPAALARIDPATNKVTATLPFGPADAEGGIAASDDSIWLVIDKNGTLARVDPATNSIRSRVAVPPGSFNPIFSNGMIWISGNTANILTAIGLSSNDLSPTNLAHYDPSPGGGAVEKIVATIPVGPGPRFLTAGGGSIWTLNQGDGTISRIDAKTRRVTATIRAGIPGTGGEICYGTGSVWATVFDIPLTRIDPKTNKVVRQWAGRGGDSVRYGHGSLWLTHYKKGLLWRIPLSQLTKASKAPAKSGR